jgi:hypothetical protein
VGLQVEAVGRQGGGAGAGGERGRAPHGGRQHRRLDHAAVAQRHRPLQDVGELAHVAGVAVGEEQPLRLGRDGGPRPAQLGGEAVEEVLQEERQVLAPLAQGRHPHLDDVEPVEEILAEPSRLHLLGQVAVGGRDDARRHGQVGAAADAADLTLLQRSQQLDLEDRRQLAHLVEEERARARHLEQALLLLGGAGEAPLLVAEELALDEALRDGTAVDGDEGLLAARSLLVDGARHHLLPGAALPGDEHGGARRGHLLDQLVHLLDGGRGAEDGLAAGPALAHPVAEDAVLRHQGAVLERLLHHQLQLLHLEGLQHVVVGAGLHGQDGGLGGGEGGHHHHLGAGRGRLHRVQDVEAGAAAEAQVGDDEIVGRAGQPRERAGRVGLRHHLVTGAAEQDPEQLPDRLLVVHDQDGGHSR